MERIEIPEPSKEETEEEQTSPSTPSGNLFSPIALEGSTIFSLPRHEVRDHVISDSYLVSGDS